MYPIKPFHERLLAYRQTREKIFKRTRSAERARKFWSTIKSKQKCLSFISQIFQQANDLRPYAAVNIFNKTYLGLLDSGASVSCIGADLATELLAENKGVKRIRSCVRTADGSRQDVAGIIKLSVTYKSESHQIEFYVIPSLVQNLYLGIDFWKTFKIAVNVVSEVSIGGLDPNRHALTCQQQSILNSAVACFPSFEVHGLGKTSLVEHSIDVGESKPVKQRHFPISPAVEKLMCDEIDRMLSLVVIEEFNSPWSSPVVLVRKPEKCDFA